MIQLLLFLLGIHLAMQFIAACYGLVDLWYCIDKYLQRVIGKILAWGILILLLNFWLVGGYQTSFQAGLVFFTLFHIIIYWIGQALRILLQDKS